MQWKHRSKIWVSFGTQEASALDPPLQLTSSETKTCLYMCTWRSSPDKRNTVSWCSSPVMILRQENNNQLGTSRKIKGDTFCCLLCVGKLKWNETLQFQRLPVFYCQWQVADDQIHVHVCHATPSTTGLPNWPAILSHLSGPVGSRWEP